MASRKGDNRHRDHAVRALVHLPCPACRRAVRLSDDNRVPEEPGAYECPNCGARFFLPEN